MPPAGHRCQNRPVRRALPLLLFLLLDLSMPTADATPPERILIFSRTAGFRHESIPVAVHTLAKLADEAGMAADATEDATAFTPANLARYRVIVFASTTGNVLDRAQQQAMEAFIHGGGGFVGVHAAADTGYDWPWYGQLVGARFRDHPPGLQHSRVQPEHEGVAVGDAWPVHDEFYNYDHNPRGQVQVIATLDERLYAGGGMGADHPIAWHHDVGGGRAWYTGLGHTEAIYAQPEFLDQLREGLAYARGAAGAGSPTPPSR